MECKPNKVTFTVSRTQIMEVEISEAEGFHMPTTLKEVMALHSDIHVNPTGYSCDHKEWETTDIEVNNLEFE